MPVVLPANQQQMQQLQQMQLQQMQQMRLPSQKRQKVTLPVRACGASAAADSRGARTATATVRSHTVGSLLFLK